MNNNLTIDDIFESAEANNGRIFELVPKGDPKKRSFGYGGADKKTNPTIYFTIAFKHANGSTSLYNSLTLKGITNFGKAKINEKSNKLCIPFRKTELSEYIGEKYEAKKHSDKQSKERKNKKHVENNNKAFEAMELISKGMDYIFDSLKREGQKHSYLKLKSKKNRSTSEETKFNAIPDDIKDDADTNGLMFEEPQGIPIYSTLAKKFRQIDNDDGDEGYSPILRTLTQDPKTNELINIDKPFYKVNLNYCKDTRVVKNDEWVKSSSDDGKRTKVSYSKDFIYDRFMFKKEIICEPAEYLEPIEKKEYTKLAKSKKNRKHVIKRCGMYFRKHPMTADNINKIIKPFSILTIKLKINSFIVHGFGCSPSLTVEKIILSRNLFNTYDTNDDVNESLDDLLDDEGDSDSELESDSDEDDNEDDVKGSSEDNEDEGGRDEDEKVVEEEEEDEEDEEEQVPTPKPKKSRKKKSKKQKKRKRRNATVDSEDDETTNNNEVNEESDFDQ